LKRGKRGIIESPGKIFTATAKIFFDSRARSTVHCRATFYPGEAHLSALVNHPDEMLGGLTA
jgi:hypothetical protein